MARARTKEPDRRTFLGGTDAPAVLGVSPWMTAVDLWRLKTGRVKPEPDPERDRRLERGKRLEPFICEMVVDKLRDQGHEVKVLARNEAQRLGIPTVPGSELRKPVAHLGAHRAEVQEALDTLFGAY